MSDRASHDAERNLSDNVSLTEARAWLRGPPRAFGGHRLEERGRVLDVLLWNCTPLA